MTDLSVSIIGICLTIVASFCFNVAIVMQKKGLKQGLPVIKFEGGVKGFLKSFLEFFKNKSWIGGFFLSILGWIPYMIAQSLVGVLIVSPIMSFGLIFLVIFASRILKEKITYSEFLAMAMLIGAPILIAFSGISANSIDLYKFVIPLLIFILLFGVVGFFCYLIAIKKKGTQWEGISLIVIASLLFSIGAIFTNIFVQAFVDAKIQIISLFGWAEVFFGIFWFEYFHSWVFIGIWIVGITNIVGLVFQQNALHKGKAVLMWPIQNGISIIIPVIAGFFVFNQSVGNPYLFFVAMVMIFIAVVILSKFQADIEALNPSDGKVSKPSK